MDVPATTAVRFNRAHQSASSGQLFTIDRFAALTVFAGLVFMLTPTNLDFASANPDDLSLEAGNKLVDYLVNLAVFAGIALVTWHRRGIVLQGLSRLNIWFLGYMAWCVASLAWTAAIGETLVTLIRLLFDLLLMAIIVFSPRSPTGSAELLHRQLAILLLASLAFVVLIPGWGVTASHSVHAGSWRGITDHKNSLAQMIIFANIIWAYMWTVAPRGHARKPALLVLLALVMAVGTTSSSGILLAFMVVPLVYLLASPRLSGLVQSRVVWVAILMVLLMMAYGYVVLAGTPSYIELMAPLAQAFGKDVTLTGRTDIWMLTLEQAQNHWLAGYGVGAYWVGEVGPAAAAWKVAGIELWQAHNGFIDVFNESGAIGFVLLMAAMLTHARWAIRRLPVDRTMAMHLALLIVLAVSNLTETSYSRPMELGNILLYFMFLSRARLQLPRAAAGGNPVGH